MLLDLFKLIEVRSRLVVFVIEILIIMLRSGGIREVYFCVTNQHKNFKIEVRSRLVVFVIEILIIMLRSGGIREVYFCVTNQHKNFKIEVRSRLVVFVIDILIIMLRENSKKFLVFAFWRNSRSLFLRYQLTQKFQEYKVSKVGRRFDQKEISHPLKINNALIFYYVVCLHIQNVDTEKRYWNFSGSTLI
eukprot:TRINITY_DN1080_c0_g2_i1.p4 TRINITY_DN1080_c0_g2~~TRINITY_DN1080_c0_g2_i1.p4  ORF type:complete len:190 (-),score=8.00 TRINITY_DN1080_c0_g2_i1:196-765(-)